ncbi:MULTISPECIES: AEC family transporter [Staphylococcus]|uniref:AEC family transporter n=2 Tax=Staphylococcus hominis TaxID=1290 RepID=A0A8X8KEV4_STAHO|nr:MULTISPECIES: AEC family transporter [Staphylococcus]EUZ68444.1 AEC family malonate efflux carrier [Staphylococcus sp. M0480]MBS9539173.1 AEC family transporter [Staphylococcus hominis subsp. novobiosepticus]MCI3143206.1 AEC family transporter [Staphylococcus hominis subsp. hominis]OFK84200.1 malonate transporter [Staphylococcus sp. HMSC057A02]OFM57941.1 malonate transporter [Staphylococcus sp. HMSC059G05]OFM93610.1 malonate transporter [Staphylococcus sp. HMSC078D05]OFU76589.1 malonate t
MTEQFIIIILLIALGYLLKRINFIKSADSQVLSTLVLNVTLPSLVIVNLNSANLDLSFSILPIMMLIYGILAKVIMVALFRKYDNHVKGSVGMMAASLNIGLFAYPLVETIWPKNGMIYFGMADIGGAIIMFGVTYFVGSYYSEGSDQFNFKFLGKKLISSVPLVTYIVMFILNMANIHLPKASIDFFTIISKANMPLSMILLGIMLSFRIEKQFLPIAVKYLIVHYGLGCIAGLLVHFFLPTSDDMIKTTLLITWLLPVGVAIIPYSIQFKYKTLPLVGMVTNISIVISIIIIYIYQAIFV